MQGIQAYILAVIGSVLICSLVFEVAKNTYAKETIKLICGMFITLMIIYPFIRIDMLSMEEFSAFMELDTETAALQGKDMVNEVLHDHIKYKVEAYILEKANLPDTAIDVDIQLDKNQIPRAARIQGKYTDQVQTYLEMVLESDFGITKENQQWIGMQENSKS